MTPSLASALGRGREEIFDLASQQSRHPQRHDHRRSLSADDDAADRIRALPQLGRQLANSAPALFE
jgi:hypothetical protein